VGTTVAILTRPHWTHQLDPGHSERLRTACPIGAATVHIQIESLHNLETFTALRPLNQEGVTYPLEAILQTGDGQVEARRQTAPMKWNRRCHVPFSAIIVRIGAIITEMHNGDNGESCNTPSFLSKIPFPLSRPSMLHASADIFHRPLIDSSECKNILRTSHEAHIEGDRTDSSPKQA
jgi:hypothetical protein